MKTLMKFFAATFLLLLTMTAGAQKNLQSAVTMVDYEQAWTDYQGTLALKNNTDGEITNVKFAITYLDMSGTEMDYQEFTRSVNIPAGKTKKVDIPAYEHSRYFHYYKSESIGDGKPFKIKFQLLDYKQVGGSKTMNSTPKNAGGAENVSDISESANADKQDKDDEKHWVDPIMHWPIDFGVIFLALFFLGLWVGSYILVAVMAKKRHRNVVAWIAVSLFTTPIFVVIILLVIGEDKERLEL